MMSSSDNSDIRISLKNLGLDFIATNQLIIYWLLETYVDSQQISVENLNHERLIVSELLVVEVIYNII